jgi:copper chaperone
MRYALIAAISASIYLLGGCKSSASAHNDSQRNHNAADHQNHSGAMNQSGSSTGASAQADTHTAVITVHGMGCPQCANNVDSQLMKVQGVESVKIDMGSGKVLAKLTPNHHPTRDQLAKAIDETGFTLVKIDMPH